MSNDNGALCLIPGLDVSSDLSGLGSLHMAAPTTDINGDGVLDTATERHSGAQYVMSDMNHDGLVDHLTIVDGDGEFSAWDFRGGHWVRVDHGHAGR